MIFFYNSGSLQVSTYDKLVNGLGGLLIGKFSLPITNVEDKLLFKPIDVIFIPNSK